MTSMDTFEGLLRDDLRSAAQSAETDTGATPLDIADRYAAQRRRTMLRRSVVGVVGIAATVAVLVAGSTVLRPPPPNLPGHSTTASRTATSTSGEAVVWAPRADGSVTRYQVTIAADSSGGATIKARSLVTDETGEARVQTLLGAAFRTTSGYDLIAVIPSDAGWPTLLDPAVPAGSVRVGPVQTVQGQPYAIVVFTYADPPPSPAPTPAVLYLLPGGRLTTTTEAATVATATISGHAQGVWALPDAGWVGTLVDGLPDSSTTRRAPSAATPVVKLGLVTYDDGTSTSVDGTVFVVRGTVRGDSVSVDRAPGSTRSTVAIRTLGRDLTAISVVTDGPAGMWQDHPITTITWRDDAGGSHSWTP